MHTPGPWAYIDQVPNEVRLKRKHWAVGSAETRKGVALAFGDDDANAKLITAAPDLLAVAECEEALDMPQREGRAVLERHGWSYDDRLDLPAREFVRRLRRAAIEKATGGR